MCLSPFQPRKCKLNVRFFNFAKEMKNSDCLPQLHIPFQPLLSVSHFIAKLNTVVYTLPPINSWPPVSSLSLLLYWLKSPMTFFWLNSEDTLGLIITLDFSTAFGMGGTTPVKMVCLVSLTLHAHSLLPISQHPLLAICPLCCLTLEFIRAWSNISSSVFST
jgi:hypothetical protein